MQQSEMALIPPRTIFHTSDGICRPVEKETAQVLHEVVHFELDDEMISTLTDIGARDKGQTTVHFLFKYFVAV